MVFLSAALNCLSIEIPTFVQKSELDENSFDSGGSLQN